MNANNVYQLMPVLNKEQREEITSCWLHIQATGRVLEPPPLGHTFRRMEAESRIACVTCKADRSSWTSERAASIFTRSQNQNFQIDCRMLGEREENKRNWKLCWRYLAVFGERCFSCYWWNLHYRHRSQCSAQSHTAGSSQRINEVMVYAKNTGLIDAVSSVNIGKAFEKTQKKNMPDLCK